MVHLVPDDCDRCKRIFIFDQLGRKTLHEFQVKLLRQGLSFSLFGGRSRLSRARMAHYWHGFYPRLRVFEVFEEIVKLGVDYGLAVLFWGRFALEIFPDIYHFDVYEAVTTLRSVDITFAVHALFNARVESGSSG